jgi:class 3 adenylate cyclase
MTATAIGVSFLALVVVALWLSRRRAVARLRTVEAAHASASRQLEELQTAFHRFAPQDVVEDILERGISPRGERRNVTVLFADLVGFTSLSESTEPEVVVSVLNGYFQAMTEVISLHKGHVGKFLGDGLLATFGAPEPNPWQEQDAVRAALEMRRALVRYNEDLVERGRDPLSLAIGIHAGPVVAGLIGTSELLEYTVIGDVVNTAARIEGLTRRLGADILVSESVRTRLDARFHVREMSATQVKGKSEPVTTWAVDAFSDTLADH